jgi:hypothetical protein
MQATDINTDEKRGGLMKRFSIFTLLLLFTATLAFGHAGEVHIYLGTITQVNKDGSFVMKMTNGKDRTVLVAKTTTYTHANGQKAKASELAIGKRVSAKISKDGKTALNVKLSAKKAK